jgi:hypothetical protein
MTQISIKETIQDLPRLLEKDLDALALIHILRPWMVITGLEFEHAIMLPVKRMIDDLKRVHATVGPVVGVFDETQAQEAACRAIAKLEIITEVLMEDVVTHRAQPLEWYSNAWNYFSDPVLRLKHTVESYVEARDAILQSSASE